MSKEYTDLVIGAGVAGCVIARRLADKGGRKILLVEQRGHIGGQAYDEYHESGILIHKYGPHLFHTHSREVIDFLSRFTEWHPYEHRVIGDVDGKLVPIPFNLTSLRTLFPGKKGEGLEKRLVEKYGLEQKVPVWTLREDPEPELAELGEYVFARVFLNYTRKQWGLDPGELDKSVTSRVPVAVTEDDRYFYDRYQLMPLGGYTEMFGKMVDHRDIDLKLNTRHSDVMRLEGDRVALRDFEVSGKVYFTGPLDELFGFRFGALPYRGLEFSFETFDKEFFQPVCTVNYPNEHDYTRITEFKHCTGQKSPVTTITYEYPSDCDISKGDTPYYPIPRVENGELYDKYKAAADKIANLIPVGRLAEYRYINMNQTVITALELTE